MRKTITAIATVATFTGLMAGGASASTYEVQPGDTLWSISQEQGSNVEQLRTLNELTSDLILPEQNLIIDENKENEKYTVTTGDTLWGIAKNSGISVTDLKQVNQLASDVIHPGDQLILQSENNTPKAQPETAPASNVKSDSADEKAPASTQQAVEGKEMTVTATAYTAYCNGCSGVTATGQDLRANPEQKIIAVDPTVIPLGTKVHVEGYGNAVAGDVGGAIKGNKIDIFMPSSSDATNFGVQTVKVTILD
ncbi:3D domain-containing protein [Lederbergia lenta]|uniref:Peptidoglycan-binding protein n=1 Tax=Lederbergia lenta TaxID=1467 RepID=A0A2X4ZGG5_LEDLE|nr:3D domain-containing protein [Lederbergia lenta]MCM3109717.1 LysM peptidoglycan-binding domain-containing protein [Lederbergia lenta]MEC2324532.1 LysM peptidoglycan-binding domain-containing protein [Lederbergia lenta]SQI59554.1 peptidoglycan-binding protein [Lederbergia lenta]